MFRVRLTLFLLSLRVQTFRSYLLWCCRCAGARWVTCWAGPHVCFAVSACHLAYTRCSGPVLSMVLIITLGAYFGHFAWFELGFARSACLHISSEKSHLVDFPV